LKTTNLAKDEQGNTDEELRIVQSKKKY